MKKRVLILGITGVDKSQIFTSLRNAYPLEMPWEMIDFEKEYLFEPGKHGKKRTTFLDADIDLQIDQ